MTCKRSLVQIQLSSPKKKQLLFTKSCFFFYPSRRLGISSPHEVRCISSTPAGLYLITPWRVSCLRLDDIQCSALMIYRNKLQMICKAYALIYLRKCDIIYKKEMMVMYHFTPPKKHKKIYILINVLIILLIISITAFFHDRIEIFGIPIALWCLFNGLWSVNANWYSWFHRNDKSSSSHGFWLICLITGLAMSILLLLIHLLM